MPVWKQFDLAIWILIIAPVILQIFLVTIKRIKKKTWSRYAVLLLFVFQMVIIYGSFIEPQMVTVERYEVAFENQVLKPTTQERFFFANRTPEKEGTLRIALAADWQVGPYKQSGYLKKSVERIQKLKPDILLMPGDFVYLKPEEAQHLAPLALVTKDIPTYASLGNHDYNWREQFDRFPLDEVPHEFRYALRNKEILESYGVRVLHNDTSVLEINGQTIELVGQEDWWATDKPLVEDFYNQEIGESLTILLQHNPDGAFFQELPESINLMVAGHTHGGQIRLPGIGSLHNLPTEIGDHIDRGWFRLKNPEQFLYVTQGIGETGPRARLFAWPEVVVFDIEIHK